MGKAIQIFFVVHLCFIVAYMYVCTYICKSWKNISKNANGTYIRSRFNGASNTAYNNALGWSNFPRFPNSNP